MSFYIMVKAFFKYAPLKLTKNVGGKRNKRESVNQTFFYTSDPFVKIRTNVHIKNGAKETNIIF